MTTHDSSTTNKKRYVPRIGRLRDAAGALDRAIERESYNESNGTLMVLDDRGKTLEAEDVRVNANHGVSHQGPLTWDEYKSQLKFQARGQFERKLNDLPSIKKDPAGHLARILQEMAERNGELSIKITDGAYIKAADVIFIKETATLMSRWLTDKKSVVGKQLTRHLNILREQMVEQVSAKIKEATTPAAKLQVITNHLSKAADGSLIFTISEGFARPVDQLPCIRTGKLDLSGGMFMSELIAELTLQTIELPDAWYAEERKAALLELIDGDDLVLPGGLRIAESRVFFDSRGPGEYAMVLDRGHWSFMDHLLWLQDKCDARESTANRQQSAQRSGNDKFQPRESAAAKAKRQRAMSGGAHGDANRLGAYKDKKLDKVAESKKVRAAMQQPKGHQK
jgi:hypothetical protein